MAHEPYPYCIQCVYKVPQRTTTSTGYGKKCKRLVKTPPRNECINVFTLLNLVLPHFATPAQVEAM